ncbi:Lrp/AsnC family transcriptional regulator [Novosphingobium sp. MMS21-SN21R]|uniref:Lrp/AsnC family transcriptional regulator n=1 Tax=Novosphingobium sp. MMS21-SN21R TaxID=2969298 RepID=UPI002887E3CA|nr:Lrp/AsnC family transcriptional regulator [Novosphingobium sp. MMS21-SN21R]MDT0508338.1 Lrp/AsnC family transcriptional regulator [Novosphingobium sp. MMS21-SN21R]
MDRADIALLEAVQADSALSIADLADKVALSPSACHRRIKALEAAGVIAGYGARLAPRQLGLTVEVFVEITLTSQSREAMDRFEQAVLDFDDILECHLMSGTADYLLRVAARDLEQYDRIHRDCLARLPGVSAMRSSFSLRRIKQMQGYPVRRSTNP